MSIFLGRQPILDRKRRTYGYELLYRNGGGVAFFADPDDATRRVVEHSLLEWGLGKVVGDAIAFINVTADFLRSDLYQVLPPDRVVLEVLEFVDFGVETVQAMQSAVDAGFRVALDDLVTTSTSGIGDILPLIHIVKVDVLDLAGDELKDLVETLRRDAPWAKLLAEKVETVEVFNQCLELGFDLFQGYFFAKPDLLQRNASRTRRNPSLILLVAIQNPDITIDELTELANGDPTLVFRLLQLVNSTSMGVKRTVESVRQAIVLLGIKQVRHLAMLLAIVANSESNKELMTLSVTRARAASELIADHALVNHAYTAGLLSVIDAVFQTPMEELLEDLPVDPLVRQALLEGTGPIGDVLSIIRAYEQADVAELERIQPNGLEEIREAIGIAICSADEVLRTIDTGSARRRDGCHVSDSCVECALNSRRVFMAPR